MNRGSGELRGLPGRGGSGFNEAPIHESGKFLTIRRIMTGAPRFNEAPIHESGKYQRGESAGQARGQASMRPRFMNRGSPRRWKSADF